MSTVLTVVGIGAATTSPAAASTRPAAAAALMPPPDPGSPPAIRSGFDDHTLAGNDDGSTGAINLPFAVNFYGYTYSRLYLNNNGNLTFDAPLGQYTPQSLNQLSQPMIAPFWADVDTRVGNVVHYGYGRVDGHAAFAATWTGVGCYAEIDTVTNYFQVVLISRPDFGYGEFDIEFNYGPLTWDSGEASSGDSRCLGGVAARAGYTSGFGLSYELPGSGIDNALLGYGKSTSLADHSSGTLQSGRYLFAVRGGEPPTPSMVALGDSYASGVGTRNDDLAGAPCHRSSGAWPYLLAKVYPAAPQLEPDGFFACSGDTTVQIQNGKSGEPVSQIQQLKDFVAAFGSPALLTTTGGGDDLGFANLLKGCYVWGAPECVNDLDRKIDYLRSGAFTDLLAFFYLKVKDAAGGAREVAAVGYPFIMPKAGFWSDLHSDWHCPWLNGDAAQINSRFRTGQQLMDDAMSRAAFLAGIDFINIDNALGGHELCTGDSWINSLGISNASAGVAGHPTSTGQEHEADAVAAGLGLLAGVGHHASVNKSSAPKVRAARILPASSGPGTATATASPSVGSALAGGEATVPYTGYLWLTGATGAVTWSLTGGSLPAGLSLDASTGTISGTPTAAGTASFTVSATDSSSPPQTMSANLSMTIAAKPTVNITTASVPAATVGRAYDTTIAANGGAAPYTWSVSSGALPAGLSLDATTGEISGTPTATGSQSFTVTVTDAATPATTDSQAFTVAVAGSGSALHVTGGVQPAAQQGRGYESDLSASGGTGALLWSVVGGALPDGLSLDPGTGAISGIATGSGTSTATIQVQDSAATPNSATATISITVTAASAPSITTTGLADATVGAGYSGTLAGSGGVAPYTWTVTAGTLPDGVTVDPSGTISGTPTTPGSYSFTVSLADSSTPAARSASQDLTLTVDAAAPAPAMALVDTAAPGVVGTAYSALLMPEAGISPYTFAVTSGTLPPGLALDDAGNVAGVPTSAGTFSATVTASDSAGHSASDVVDITINSPSSLAITTTSLAHGALNDPYGAQIAVSGGSGPDTFAIADGSLPAGLSLDTTTGVISGTPTSTGTATFTVRVSDGTSTNVAAALSITVDGTLPLSVGQPDLPDGIQGVAYSQPLSASGGAAPYTWAVTGGSLPDGLTLDPSSGVVSGTPTGSGQSSFTVTATDSSPTPDTSTVSTTLVIRAAATLTVATTGLDDPSQNQPGSATQGQPFAAALEASGGTAPVSWALTRGSLPDGLSLSPDGSISGTPTTAGTFSFSVTATDASTPNAQTATQALQLTVIPVLPPYVSSIAPTSGPSTGHTQVTINGTGFSTATGVTFGSAAPLDYSIISDNQIVATAPPQALGTVDIRVIGPGGTSLAVTGDRFTYVTPPKPVVTSVQPPSGTTGGGDSINVFGSGFWGATKVEFSGTAAPAFTVLADNEIAVTTPVHGAAATNVQVVTPGGTSVTGTQDRFTFVKPPVPVITAISPTTGSAAGGYHVTITGSNFQQTSKVVIGTVAAPTFYVESPSLIDLLVPPHAAGTYDIRVTTPGGTSVAKAADKLTLIAPPKPTVTSLSPTSGLSTGGTVVDIFGTSLTGTTRVTFGGTAAPKIYPVNDSEIEVITPKHAAGSVAVLVTTPGGTSASTTASKFTYVTAPKPAITGLSPTTGKTAGGTSVTISGTAFGGASKVTFGGTAARSFTVVSSTQIVAVTPAHAAGTVTVAVTTAAGTSAAVTADRFTFSATGP